MVYTFDPQHNHYTHVLHIQVTKFLKIDVNVGMKKAQKQKIIHVVVCGM